MTATFTGTNYMAVTTMTSQYGASLYVDQCSLTITVVATNYTGIVGQMLSGNNGSSNISFTGTNVVLTSTCNSYTGTIGSLYGFLNVNMSILSCSFTENVISVQYAGVIGYINIAGYLNSTLQSGQCMLNIVAY
jgi:hypothetical protein